MPTLEKPQKDMKKTKPIRKVPNKEEQIAITEFLEKKFKGSTAKYLYNTENCYRFRVNRWGDEKLEESHFVVATITSGKIVTKIISDEEKSR